MNTGTVHTGRYDGRNDSGLARCLQGNSCSSVQIWKEAFDHFEREPKKFETNEICSIMDTQITGWKRDGIHRFSKEGYGRQRSWVREGTEEGGNEPDKDGFTKLTKAEQLELPFDLPTERKADFDIGRLQIFCKFIAC